METSPQLQLPPQQNASPEAHRTQSGWERMTAISAVSVAALALAATLWQAAEQREHNRLSVRPVLELVVGHGDGQAGYEVYLANNGLGPALIDRVEIVADGQTFAAVEPLLRLRELNLSCFGRGGLSGVLTPESQRQVLRLLESDTCTAEKTRLRDALKGASLTIFYRSMYDEQLILQSDFWVES